MITSAAPLMLCCVDYAARDVRVGLDDEAKTKLSPLNAVLLFFCSLVVRVKPGLMSFVVDKPNPSLLGLFFCSEHFFCC